MLPITYSKAEVKQKMLDSCITITGRRAICRSHAKINLTLDVLSKLDNGYHTIKTIMQTVSLFDLIIIDKTHNGITLSTNLKYLPTNNKNIAYKAAEAFFSAANINGGAKIMIHKNIPVSAGLAGGSGNCAVVLCALNLLYNSPLSDTELLKLGKSLGADVPYCMTGSTQLSEGIGEILTPLPSAPKMCILMVKPPINISTAAIYEHIDNVEIPVRPDTDKMIKAIKNADIETIAQNLCNVMESVSSNMHPVIKDIKNTMMTNGALGSLMSGSGPTVFGIFDDVKKAKACADGFLHQYKDVFLVNTVEL